MRRSRYVLAGQIIGAMLQAGIQLIEDGRALDGVAIVGPALAMLVIVLRRGLHDDAREGA